MGVGGLGKHLVWAMDPRNPSALVSLVCHPQTIEKLAGAGLSSKLGEFWGLVHGNPPPHPDPEAPSYELGLCLRKPRAVFKGVKRPLHFGHSAADRDVYVYVTNPTVTYRIKDHMTFGPVLDPDKAPIESVFATFVTFDQGHVDQIVSNMRQAPDHEVGGIVTFWEWTERSRKDSYLPNEHETRYSTRLL